MDGCWIFFPDEVQNKVVLALRKLEQASILLNKELHLFQFRTILQSGVFNGRY